MHVSSVSMSQKAVIITRGLLKAARLEIGPKAKTGVSAVITHTSRQRMSHACRACRAVHGKKAGPGTCTLDPNLRGLKNKQHS